ncbi:MAG: hypothetical protein KH420_04730 [Clostridiales bacterium]|nr:hypothetical protein [Clostridiales bacterium]
MNSKAFRFHPSLCIAGENVKTFAKFPQGTMESGRIFQKLHLCVQLLADWGIEVNKPFAKRQKAGKGGWQMTGEEMAEAIVRVEERSRRNEGRIKNLENTRELLNKTATSVEVMTAKLATIEHNVDLLMQKVDKLENLPGKRWEAVLEKALLVVVGVVITAALAKLGVAG